MHPTRHGTDYSTLFWTSAVRPLTDFGMVWIGLARSGTDFGQTSTDWHRFRTGMVRNCASSKRRGSSTSGKRRSPFLENIFSGIRERSSSSRRQTSSSSDLKRSSCFSGGHSQAQISQHGSFSDPDRHGSVRYIPDILLICNGNAKNHDSKAGFLLGTSKAGNLQRTICATYDP